VRKEDILSIRDKMTVRKECRDGRSQIMGVVVVRRAMVGRPNEPKSAMLNIPRTTQADHFLVFLGGLYLTRMSVPLPFESLGCGPYQFETV
jgi:hypothetical protein